jgi:hypothetical protein
LKGKKISIDVERFPYKEKDVIEDRVASMNSRLKQESQAYKKLLILFYKARKKKKKFPAKSQNYTAL